MPIALFFILKIALIFYGFCDSIQTLAVLFLWKMLLVF